MYDLFFDYITRYSKQNLSISEKELLASAWQPKRIKKSHLFLSEGDVCQYTGFILKGAMRQYSVDERGAEHVLQLAIENWWVVDRESYINQTPSRYFIDAWEDTQLIVLHRSKLDAILEIPAIRWMFWHMDQNNHIASQKRLDDVISLSALKRYENFQQKYPEIVQRFPQHQIASYLGIAKETLSRLRRPG